MLQTEYLLNNQKQIVESTDGAAVKRSRTLF